eukprot:c19787_g1_i1 orf=482-2593(-)
MNALLQRQWRCCNLPRSQRAPLSEVQELLSRRFYGTFEADAAENLGEAEDSFLPVNFAASNAETLGFTAAKTNVGQIFPLKSVVSTETVALYGERTSDFTSSEVQESVEHVSIRRRIHDFMSVDSILDAKYSRRAQDWFMFARCGWSHTSVRSFHISAAKSAENQADWRPSAGRAGHFPSASPALDISQLTGQQQRDIAIYKELEEYVLRKHGNKPEFLKMLDEYNPLAEMKEPTIEDFRRPDRELPPLDRVTIALDTEEQYRITRKTKWIIKQLRSPLMNDVPSLLEQWVKTMYPKRSDWLDLLKEFTDEKEQDLLFQIFEFALLEDTFEVKSQDLTRLIVKYMNLERYDDVERLMGTLDSKGFPPDFVVCTLLLDMNCKLRRLDKAREMFDRIRSLDYVPDVTACTQLIEFYCSTGNPEAGEMILAEMESEKVHGTVDTYLAVLKGYGKLGRAQEAMRIFAMMKEDIFLKPHMGPSVYSALMNAYSQANMLPSAVLTMEDMLLSGLVPEDECVSLLIAAYEKKNQFEKALDVLLKLESKAIRPGLDTLNVLIGWFGKLGLVEEAEILFKTIEAKVDVPDCKAYASLFSTYARTGSVEKAKAILNSLEEKGLVLTASAYEQMILALLDGKQPQEAQSMRDQMISQGHTPSDEVERALLGLQTDSFLSGVSISSEEATQSSGIETESFLAGVSKNMDEAPQSV